MGSTPALQLQVGAPAPGFSAGNQERVNSNGTVSAEDKAEIDRLRATHDLWKSYSPEWNLYMSAYEGGTDIANELNMFKHQRENDEDFLDRVRRIHYINYCDVLVDFFTNFIFAETIQRDPDESVRDWYDDFITDVNRRGDSIDDFMRTLSDDVQIYGMSYILVDAPKLVATAGEVVTKQMETDQKIRPYWVSIKPDEITDWIVDSFDVFSYVKRKQTIYRMNAGGNKQVIEQYEERYLDVTEMSEIDVTDSLNPILLPMTSIPNPSNEISMLVTRFKRSKRWPHMGNSFLRDFAYNNREIMNITSLIQEFLYRQCFNQLAKETDTTVPTSSQEDGVLGTANVIEFPKGAEMPKYITPPSEPAKFLQDERAKIQQEMFRRAAQDTLNELFNGEGKSGFSQAQSFSKTVPFIASRADTLERAEGLLMSLTMKFVNKDWKGKIKYKDRYEITNISDAIGQLVSLGRDLMLPSKTFVVGEMKRLVAEFDGKVPPDVMVVINKEIDALDFPEWQDVQRQALIGPDKPAPDGNSPAAKGKSKSKGTMTEAQGKST